MCKRYITFLIIALLAVACSSAPQPTEKPVASSAALQGVESPSPGLYPLHERTFKTDSVEEVPRHSAQRNERSSYVFKPGDKFKITVWGEDMTENIIVQPDGFISYQLVGDINAAGLTIGDLKAKIEKRLSRFIKKPLVSIIPKSFDGNFVTVLGAVENPGRKIVSRNDRVLDALAQAGGIKMSAETANPGELGVLQKAYLSRDGKLMGVDFSKLVYEGDMSQNIPIMLGDFIYVPSSANEVVYVTGEVSRPMAVQFRGKPTIMQVLSVAGGIRYTGNKSAVYLVRGSISDPKVQRVDYSAIVAGKATDVYVKPGDIVHVSETAITKIERFSTQIIPFLNAIVEGDRASTAVQGW